ncbi:S8 family peptidase [Micromonospora sp. NPDC049559]|uniref:S8 family peptidase n=1 Tax=Micromonospora sp. NPDC049559 TaxID=3155923 RepID=UPI0034319AE4
MPRRPRQGTALIAATALVLTLHSGAAVAAQPTSPGAPAAPVNPMSGREVTLVTGDVVRVDAGGKAVGFRPAKGRESIPVTMTELKGHSYVLPADTSALISAGQLDRRLFDVTGLTDPAYQQLTGGGVPVIVRYADGAAQRSAARSTLRANSGADVRADLRSVNAEALTVPEERAASAWSSLTRPSARGRTLAPGVTGIRLDGVVRASLDVSVPQIGAPAAWAAGYDGAGVKVAVLDSGIDTTHPDLAPQVVASANFTDTADALDHYGHGTHVASILAGTGARSDGKYRGVAPGVRLLNGKVMNDRGAGTESSIIAGMQWAVDQGAKVVNMSLGGPDQPGLDPLEEAVNRLSDRALFVVAAGNSGPFDATVGTPASADAALTVGAVDRTDALAEFSSRGPRVGDSALKPDLTAPGVDITAAAATGSQLDGTLPHPAPGYLTMPGTSMATPHVAGSAALLAQQHPDWGPARLKAALVGSAKPGAYRPMQGGSGRVDVAHAITQDVLAEPASLSFGAALWPHADDAPMTRTLTYRNLGAAPLTLELAAQGTGPDGTPTPDGFFTLSATQLTVPANGTASVEVTADTRIGGSIEGVYDLAVTATGAGRSVRTVGAVNREGEMYDLTFKATARDGSIPDQDEWYGWVYDFARGFMTEVSGDGGTARLRLPKGTYTVLGEVPLIDPETQVYVGDDRVGAPEMRLTADTTIPVDARTTRPMDIRPPDAGAQLGNAYYTLTGKDGSNPVSNYLSDMPQGHRTRWVGPTPPRGTAYTTLIATFANPDTGTSYHLTDVTEGFYTGVVLHPRLADLARLTVHAGATKPNRWAYLISTPAIKAPAAYHAPDLPSTTTVYLTGNQRWQRTFEQRFGAAEAAYAEPFRYYRAGHTYQEYWNAPVFGPALAPDAITGAPAGLTRDGNRLTGAVNPFADGAGHDGKSRYDATLSSTVLYRNGREYARASDILDAIGFDLPADRATYQLVTTADRTASGVSTGSGKVTWSATFTSARTAAATRIPVGVVRYAPDLAADGTATAGVRDDVKVTVQGSTDSWRLASLTVYASYDHGATWQRLKVHGGEVTVANPPAGGTVSFKADFRDRDGHTYTQTVVDAYTTR